MRYDDLAIEIRELPGGEYRTEITSSTQGRRSGPFALPFDPAELEGALTALERRVWRSRLGDEAGGAPDSPPAAEGDGQTLSSPEDFGDRLYAALFHDETANLLHASLGAVEEASAGQAGAGSERGLLLRFVFDQDAAELTELGIVPWEMLRRGDRREYLARYLRTSIARTITVHRPPARPLRGSGTLRVLLAEASPKDLAHLDTRRETAAVRRALEELGGIEVTHLPHADLASLSHELKWGGHHVLHFMGHGSFIERPGTPEEGGPARAEAFVYLEGPGHSSQKVPAQTFADTAKRSPSLRLVVLNACDTGMLPRHRGRDPFNSTAAALAMAGLPAVVAMQFPISDPAAIAFSRAFYESLAHGEPLAAALVDGRLGISNEGCSRQPQTLEWVTPVLYLQGEDAPMVDRAAAREAARGAEAARGGAALAAAERARPEPPLRLGVRSLVGLGQGLEGEADRVLDLTRHFDGRSIRDEALWHMEVLPELREFLAEGATTGRPLTLDLAAHQSLAFAAGSFLEAKSGVEISVVQRGMKGTYSWPARPGELSDEPLWRELESVGRDGAEHDVAVAVSVTWEILADVDLYVKREELPVGRILHAAVAPETSPTAVRDGAHALRLAQTLGRAIRERSPEERLGTLHLFAAAPNALLVFLGQMAPALGPVQLYEYDFDTKAPGAYRPSFRLPARKD